MNIFKKGLDGFTSLFRKGDSLKKSLAKKGTGLDLYDVLENSYADEKAQENFAKAEGYILDKDLSSSTEQFYYNPDTNKLLMSVRGTASLDDVKTDYEMLRGRLKDTERYKKADRKLKEAKEKYAGYDTTIAGHSLGSAIGSRIASGNDKVISYNQGDMGGKTNKNETKIRTSGDIISALGSWGSHTLNMGGRRLANPLDWYEAHNLKNLKGKGFII